MDELKAKRVAILATHGFEEIELTSPRNALEEAGATITIISEKSGTIKGWNEGNWSIDLKVDRTLKHATELDYDALMLPGGVMNPDKLRQNKEAVEFVRSFFKTHKPVAAICHGPQLLIEADVVRGRKMTSYPSIRTDLINAGAIWSDEECVVDEGLVTARSPADLAAFNRKLVEEIWEGKHAGQTT